MTAVIKVIDKESVDPITVESLLKYEGNKEGQNKIIGGYQSHKNCYHLFIVISNETADIYQNEQSVDFFNILMT